MVTALVGGNGHLGGLRGGSPVLIAALGPRGSAKSSVLNRVFSARFAEAASRLEQKTLGAQLERHYFAETDVAVADVEGFDSSDEKRYKLQGRAMTLAVSIADIVIVNAYLHDISRNISAVLDPITSAIAEMAKMEEDKVIPTRDQKTPLLLVLRDFDSGDIAVDEVIEGVKAEVPATISDRFTVDVLTMRSFHVQPDEYETDVIALREKCQQLVTAAAEDLRNKDVTARVWGVLGQDEKDVPNKSELEATLNCDVAFRAAWAEVEETVSTWSDAIESGRIYDDFGKMCSELKESALRRLELESGTSRNSAAFRRKRDELIFDIHRHVEDLFKKEIYLLKDEEFTNFTAALEGVQGGPDMGNRVNALVKRSKQSFKARAEALRPKGVRNRYSAERKELFQNIKESSASRLQFAQLSGAYQPPKREPIAIGIHYLHPHPFGKDSRSEQLNMNDEVEFDVGRFRSRKDIGEPLRGPRSRRESRDFEDALEQYRVDVSSK